MPGPIERVGLAQLQVPFKTLHPSGSGQVQVRQSILVAVETAGGFVGLGECAPAPIEATDAMIRRLWDELAGRVVPALMGHEVASFESIEEIARGWEGVHPSASAGGETALWDLLGQGRHESLAELLGASEARIEAGVESALSVGLAPTVVDLLRAIEPHLSEGYQQIMLAIAPGRDLEFVEAVAQHHPELLLAVDAGGRFDRSHAEVFRRLDEALPLWIEAPYPPEDLDGLVALQAELVTPISLDARHAEAIRRGACRMARVSIQDAGGLGPARALHDFCRQHGVGCWVATGPELGVGLTQAIHLATLPNCKDPIDATPPARWYTDDVVVPAIEFDAPGRFLVPTRPGLGHLLDPLKVRRHQVRHQQWSIGD
jgi:O-succinylbenzoate synthase